MISAWWLIPALMVGAMIGVFMVAICKASWKDDD